MFNHYPNFAPVIMANVMVKQLIDIIPFELSNTAYFTVFGAIFGYTYGTISTVFRIRDFNGLIKIILFIVKVMISTMLVVNFGALILCIEIILLLAYLVFKLGKNKTTTKKVTSYTPSDNQHNILIAEFLEEYEKSKKGYEGGQDV